MPSKQTASVDYPQAVTQQIALLAQNIVTARKRRGETQAQWAKKLGVSQPTMARIERGDPAVAMVSYVMCMWLINPASGLAELIAPQADSAALEREVRKVHARHSRSAPARPVDRATPAVPPPSHASGAATAAGLAALLPPIKLAPQ